MLDRVGFDYHVRMGMVWKQLLSRRRVNCRPGISDAPDEPARSAFERDWDRVVFSTAFRRMHDKTQLFPLPEDDVVHSRLTHSLEVSAVGRSLGVAVDSGTLYERILRVTDFVSGMTDRAALGTYRRLEGIAIPGRIA
jgi:dGTP triphosphohydrolase